MTEIEKRLLRELIVAVRLAIKFDCYDANELDRILQALQIRSTWPADLFAQ